MVSRDTWNRQEIVIGGGIDFVDLKIPLACVASDIPGCAGVVIGEGLVLEGVRASISILGVFTLVR